MQCRGADLMDDGFHGHAGTQIVTDERQRDPVGVRSGGEMTEGGWIERAPIAAMYKESDRRISPGGRPEDVDLLPTAPAIGNAELRVRMRRAKGLCIAGPADEDGRMLGHARAVVVFRLVVDRGQGALSRPNGGTVCESDTACKRRLAAKPRSPR